ncbi:MAG: hypothetical protein ABI068_08075 [Ktedonobacterales bacterium]
MRVFIYRIQHFHLSDLLRITSAVAHAVSGRYRPIWGGRLATLSAPLLLAMLALLAGCSSSAGTSAQPTATATLSAPTATLTAMQRCQALAHFHGSGAATAPTSFNDVPFPVNAVSTAPTHYGGGAGQFTVTEFDVCAPDSSEASVDAFYAAQMTDKGWTQSALYPYDAAAQTACGDPYCWGEGNVPRFVSLETVTDAGSGLTTYHLRLAAPPPAPSCGAGYSATYSDQLGDSQDNTSLYANILLPPLTAFQNDSSTGILGYLLCSAGNTTSVTAFMSKHLGAQGWQQQSSTSACVSASGYGHATCWKNGSHYLTFASNSATDWLLRFQNPTM